MFVLSQISKILEIILVIFKSDKVLEKVDYFVQMNQQGSGILEYKVVLKIIEVVLFQDNQVKKVVLLVMLKQVRSEEVFKVVVIIICQCQQKVLSKIQVQKVEQVVKLVLYFDLIQLLVEIVSFEVDLVKEQQVYVKCLCIYCLSVVLIMCDKGVWYKEDWCKKIECIGNFNYFDEVCWQKFYGSLWLLVLINCDGIIYEVQVLEFFGELIFDQVVQCIVCLVVFYVLFSGDLVDIDWLEIICIWCFECGDWLFSKQCW